MEFQRCAPIQVAQRTVAASFPPRSSHAPNASLLASCVDRVRLDLGDRAVLRDVSLAVPRGGITVVLGPSGSGKSTLLAALAGELAPVDGRIEVLGQEVPFGRSRALLEFRKGMGVLLQGNGLLSDLTVALS